MVLEITNLSISGNKIIIFILFLLIIIMIILYWIVFQNMHYISQFWTDEGKKINSQPSLRIVFFFESKDEVFLSSNPNVAAKLWSRNIFHEPYWTFMGPLWYARAAGKWYHLRRIIIIDYLCACAHVSKTINIVDLCDDNMMERRIEKPTPSNCKAGLLPA